jgi:3-oxoacyl-[acyl-carrier protein] reductase
MGELSGQVAIVTGSGTGIGRASALALAAAGAQVVVNYSRSSDEAEAVVAEIARAGYPPALAIRADVASREAVSEMVARTLQELDRVDVLVNNAGVSLRARLLEIDDATWRTVIDVNLTGTFLCSQAVVPAMQRRGRGRIINISSVAGLLAMPGAPHYAAAKAGVLGFTRSIAQDLAPEILVNVIAPGWVETRMNAVDDEYVRRETARQTPLGRWGTPKEIAETVVFLATTNNFMTGQVLVADGGLGNVYSAL